ncbi:Transmembrane protein 53 [Gracilariopsis chorda]|uniref:Transmembrane protein 53 n=1 Tax=Gracilariopsis chorda TaxID=448386 RepID=A0A2V3J6K6_9FLOR|nr:Transmembrane protein 53 [Gracilariopsis chorda]|eukprot:PXF50004.1 Transmembrane protein 53 [Gracilariopsis chorda]
MEGVEEYKKKTNTGDTVIIRILNPSSTSAPTVVVLGWLGASIKHLAKYAAVYESMSYNTVCLSCPPSVVFAMRPIASAKFLLSALRILAADDRLTAGGLVFHKLSNAGATVSPHLSDFFAGASSDLVKPDDQVVVNKCKQAIAAVVFDSAPAYMHTELGAGALIQALRVPPGVLSNIVAALYALYAWFQRIFVMDVPVFFWQGVTNARYLCPEQYIYSAADRLLDSVSLEALIERRRGDGVDVRGVFRVEDSDHVLILRKHPEKYTEIIRALNEWGVNAWRRRNRVKEWTLSQEPSRSKHSWAKL